MLPEHSDQADYFHTQGSYAGEDAVRVDIKRLRQQDLRHATKVVARTLVDLTA